MVLKTGTFSKSGTTIFNKLECICVCPDQGLKVLSVSLVGKALVVWGENGKTFVNFVQDSGFDSQLRK